MRKCRWLILSLALLLAAALAAGCGSKTQESQKEEAKEEDKLNLVLSECAGGRRRCGRADLPDRVFH